MSLLRYLHIGSLVSIGQDFLILRFDDTRNVGETATANLNASVEYFMESMRFEKFPSIIS